MNESTAMTQQEIFLNLKKNGKDNVLQTIDNCIFVLEHDKNLRGTIRFNVLTERDCIVGDVGWERTGSAITERDMSYLKLYFERHYHLNHEKALRDAIRIVANENRFHPIQEYLQALRWDGQPRISHALHRFLGAEECLFNTECLKIFMLGAISRVFHPGIKFELMLCLVGSQGAGKSSFFRLLAVRDEWFSDDLKKIDDDNVYRKMQGHWIIEMHKRFSFARLHQLVNNQRCNISQRENKGFGKQRKCFLFPVRNTPTSDVARRESDSQYGKGLHRLTNWFVNCCISRVSL